MEIIGNDFHGNYSGIVWFSSVSCLLADAASGGCWKQNVGVVFHKSLDREI